MDWGSKIQGLEFRVWGC